MTRLGWNNLLWNYTGHTPMLRWIDVIDQRHLYTSQPCCFIMQCV